MSPNSISHGTYATRCRELLSLVKRLRAIGAQTELDLPRIAVIGNQSAGKSSVVEAISGITVPRDAGTCTRCPIECRMASSEASWSCRISIRWEFNAKGERLPSVSEVPFGKTISSPEQVELALRRAQAAVLYPSVPAARFLKMSVSELDEPTKNLKALKFSRSVICVDLQGPGLADLAFVDLPGIIHNADSLTVRQLEDLVMSHIKDNAIILVALPMSDDIENQKALSLARSVDPDGHRTIGVLTKPDILVSGSTAALGLWMDVIEGQRHHLDLGYYCTRQPDDAERARGCTSAQAREAEDVFFGSTKPWCNSLHPDRFGTGNLIKALNTHLVRMIESTIPRVRAETTRLLDECTRGLDEIPPAITDHTNYTMKLLATFCLTVDQHVQGGGAFCGLIQKHRKTYSSFRRDIRLTAPRFVPFPSASKATMEFEDNLASDSDASSDEEDDDCVLSQNPIYLEDVREHIQKSVTRELPDNVPFQSKVTLIQDFQRTWEASAIRCLNEVRGSMLAALCASIEEQFSRHEHLRRHVFAFVTEHVNYHHERCMERIVEQLGTERTPFTQNTRDLVRQKEKWHTRYKRARAGPESVLPQPAIPIVANTSEPFWKRQDHPPIRYPFNASPQPGFRKPSTFRQATELPSMFPPSTSPFSSSSRVSRKPTDQTPFTPQLSMQCNDRTINEVLAGLANLGITGLTREDLAKLIPQDEYTTEMIVMAEVRGYFQIAYKRVIDNIPSLVDLLFVKAISKDLQSCLISKLAIGTSSPNHLAEYLEEDPQISAQREKMATQMHMLKEVDTELHRFGIRTHN
ncbi:hypothetical protein HYDPIDRAFT_106826 [Hydnomerulius pinastri MD-312]|nr:hypothetical protein HYDPIDRAFT_106826 [Hydnomerulius pinastri MD-312]